MDMSSARLKLALPQVALRLWRPATNSVFEIDLERLPQQNVPSAQGNNHFHAQQQQQQHYQQQQYQQQQYQQQRQQQYGKNYLHSQKDDMGLM